MKCITLKQDLRMKSETDKSGIFDHKIYGFVTIGTKGQIVIPADAREALGIGTGDHMFVVCSKKKGIIALVPESNAVEFVKKINRKVEDFEALRVRGPLENEE